MNEIARELRAIRIELRLIAELAAWNQVEGETDAFDQLDERRKELQEDSRR